MALHFHISLLSITLFVPPFLVLVYRCLKLVPQYIQARKLDLPIFVSLFTWQDLIWGLMHPYFLWLEHLPFGLGKGVKFSYFGWTVSDRADTHLELGNAFCIVSPNHLEIVCAEPSVSEEVTQKWRFWTKSPELYNLFQNFGPNVNTTNHADWQRHRKITSQAFREGTYDLVWEESLKQADQLLHAIERRGQNNLVKLREDFALLAMHVLSSAVFGHSYNYGAGLQQVEAGHKLSYFASLAFIMHNIMSVILFNGLQAPDWILPSFLRNVKLAVSEYQQYLTEAVQQEQRAGMNKRSGASLVTALVQANEDAKNETHSAGGLPMHLSDEELYGNMYMFNLCWLRNHVVLPQLLDPTPRPPARTTRLDPGGDR
jgi:cytochrome P450